MNFQHDEQYPLSPKQEGLAEGYEHGFITCRGETEEEMRRYAENFYSDKHEAFDIDGLLATRPDFIEGVIEGAKAGREVQNFFPQLFPKARNTERQGATV